MRKPISMGRLGAAVLVAACGGCADKLELRAMTYNAALAPDFEPFAAERKPLVVDALSSLAPELDLLCVQEFWRGEDLDDLTGALEGELPHVLRQPPLPGSGDCSLEELGSLGGCLQTSCEGLEGVELVGCAQQACGAELGGLSGGCLGCILNTVGEPLEGCLGDGSAPNDPAVFGGAYDTALLSRYPFEATTVAPLPSYFVRASAMHALVQVPVLGPVHAFCTHLGSPLGLIPYAGAYGSWDGEHAAQVESLVEFIQSEASDSLPVIVLGDLNMGPAVGTSVALLADQYQTLLDEGLSNPYAEQLDAPCTDCADNAFHFANPEYEDTLIDQVLIRDFPTHETAAARVLDEGIELGDIPWNLSDHYAVRVELSRKNERGHPGRR